MEQRIAERLSETPTTARVLARSLGTQKKVINRILYKLEREERAQKDDSIPPAWTTLGGQPRPQTTQPNIPLILVDLGNVHDVLQKLERLARQGDVKVWAFADLAFNGFGVNPAPHPSITVEQAKRPHRNAADIRLIWRVAQLVLTSTTPQTFYVVTKDQGFRTLEDMAGAAGHKLSFAKDWEQLWEFIKFDM